MQVTPFWKDGSKEQTRLVIQMRRESYRNCVNCYAPIDPRFSKGGICSKCNFALYANGMEGYRIKIGQVGAITINYQQHLHRKFFGCNVGVAYRGLKEDRIRCDFIKEETIVKASAVLDKHLLNSERTLLYKDIQKVKNVARRILYYQVLYGIAYFIVESDKFRHLAHYQASCVRAMFNDVNRIYIRQMKSKGLPYDTPRYTAKLNSQVVNDYKAIVRAIEPILVELVSVEEV